MSGESARDPASVEPDGHDRADDDGFDNGGLDHGGAEAAARLLLALTALYVQRSNHTAAEQQQYTELALGLIDKAAPAACATVAVRLQRHPDAPAAVMARLAAAQFPLAPGIQDSNIQDFGVHDPHAAALRQFEAEPLFDRDLFAAFPGEEPAGDAFARDEPAGAVVAGAAPAVVASGALPTPSFPAPARAPLTPEFGAAFFAAPPAERRRMLSGIAVPDPAEAADTERGRRFHVRVDVAPWHGRTGAFSRDFARLIDAPANLCDRILNDPWGEPMVVAARATGMPVAILQRILLLASPATHHPVQRVYELTDLYHALDGRTARDLLAVWRSTAADGADASGNAAAPGNRLPAPIPQAPAEASDVRARLRALNARIEHKGTR